jgi:hypothetical protein
MGWNKQYNHLKPIMTTLCIDNRNVKMLHLVRYNVIKQDNTRYLIKFKSGGAKWYSKNRFTDTQPIHKPKSIRVIENTLINTLF